MLFNINPYRTEGRRQSLISIKTYGNCKRHLVSSLVPHLGNLALVVFVSLTQTRVTREERISTRNSLHQIVVQVCLWSIFLINYCGRRAQATRWFEVLPLAVAQEIKTSLPSHWPAFLYISCFCYCLGFWTDFPRRSTVREMYKPNKIFPP